mmetsp:Transcript_25015/g.41443  ORF Transcript_25015/g.41443 Transcript_25015/m.41443 type:complete len:161 (+) Transcript_25015:102-584(+)
MESPAMASTITVDISLTEPEQVLLASFGVLLGAGACLELLRSSTSRPIVLLVVTGTVLSTLLVLLWIAGVVHEAAAHPVQWLSNLSVLQRVELGVLNISCLSWIVAVLRHACGRSRSRGKLSPSERHLNHKTKASPKVCRSMYMSDAERYYGASIHPRAV